MPCTSRNSATNVNTCEDETSENEVNNTEQDGILAYFFAVDQMDIDTDIEIA